MTDMTTEYWVCAGYADGPLQGRHLSEDGLHALCNPKGQALHWGVKLTLEDAFLHDLLCDGCTEKALS